MSKKIREDASLYEVVSEIYERYRDRVVIVPEFLATEAMQAIGAKLHDNARWYLAAHLQFRQIARSFCNKKFDPVEAEIEQDEMFPVLQERYPRAPSSKRAQPEYVLRELMTREDIEHNVHRLRQEAQAKAKHADALEAWGHDKFPPRPRKGPRPRNPDSPTPASSPVIVPSENVVPLSAARKKIAIPNPHRHWAWQSPYPLRYENVS